MVGDMYCYAILDCVLLFLECVCVLNYNTSFILAIISKGIFIILVCPFNFSRIFTTDIAY